MGIYPLPTSSFLRSSYLLDSSVNISICLSTLVSSYTKRLWARVSYSATPKNLRVEASNSLSSKSADISPIDQYPLHTSTTTEGSDTYRFPKLKGSENYESWGVDVTSALKAKGLWWIISGKLGKPEIPESKAATAATREYASAINHWKDKNDRACENAP